MTIKPANQLEAEQPKIENLDDLKRWLTSQGIDISYWGEKSAKSVEDLWIELADGETYLQNNPPLRAISVAQVIIRRGDEVLIEAEQEFKDKRRRCRDIPPSEKIKQGENYLDAIFRCLREELHIDLDHVEILPSTYHQEFSVRTSPSYPGLRTQYNFHIIEARVGELPGTDFWTTETANNGQDPIKRHHWVWRDQANAV